MRLRSQSFHARSPDLTWRQRLSYFAIGTYYLGGLTTAAFLLFPYVYLWAGVQPAKMSFAAFLTMSSPVALCGLATYLYVQRWLCDPSERGLHWRGFMLKVASWPVYVAGTLLAIARVEIPYVPTVKGPVRGRLLRLAWPQLVLIAVFTATAVSTTYVRLRIAPEASLPLTAEAVWGMLTFATLPVLAAFGALYAAWQARTPAPGAAWDEIDVERLGGEL